jgi:hypothetical protein
MTLLRYMVVLASMYEGFWHSFARLCPETPAELETMGELHGSKQVASHGQDAHIKQGNCTATEANRVASVQTLKRVSPEERPVSDLDRGQNASKQCHLLLQEYIGRSIGMVTTAI